MRKIFIGNMTSEITDTAASDIVITPAQIVMAIGAHMNIKHPIVDPKKNAKTPVQTRMQKVVMPSTGPFNHMIFATKAPTAYAARNK